MLDLEARIREVLALLEGDVARVRTGERAWQPFSGYRVWCVAIPIEPYFFSWIAQFRTSPGTFQTTQRW